MPRSARGPPLWRRFFLRGSASGGWHRWPRCEPRGRATPEDSPARHRSTRLAAPAASHPGRLLPRDRDGTVPTGGRDGRPSPPPGAGTNVRADRRQRASRTEDVPHFDGAVVLEMRMIQSELDGFVIVSGFNHVKAADHFFRFAIRAVGDLRRRAGLALHYAAGMIFQPLAACRERLLGPGHVLFGGLLHFLGAHLLPLFGIVIKQEHVLRHGWFSFCTVVT